MIETTETDKTAPIIEKHSPLRLLVAPMMDWTDRHCRYFHRLLTPNALLYTEMVTSAAIVHGDRERLLGFDAAEQPVALQLGGSDPRELAAAARIGADLGYRVQSGRFGACLMREPELVGECVVAMRNAVTIPVTVKCRIGVDEQDEYAALQRFVSVQRDAGCRVLIVHARKAWLKGLSPKENRDVPPLNYQRVYHLKQDFPDLDIVINGGITNVAAVQEHLRHVDAVMLGRAAYHDPYILAELEHALYATPLPSRDDVLLQMQEYIVACRVHGISLHHISRHLLGLYLGQPGARIFRRYLSEHMHLSEAGSEVLANAMAATQAQRQAA
jgi:tRNA-dihydrouridine synthase A